VNAAPLRAFPSWFLRIECECCGNDRMIAETHMPRGMVPDRPPRLPRGQCDHAAAQFFRDAFLVGASLALLAQCLCAHWLTEDHRNRAQAQGC